MEAISRKRRSEECSFVQQRKMHINQKIVDSNNEIKMEIIKAKTMERLFKAVQTNKFNKNNNNDEEPSSKLHLYEQYSIAGNGEIQLLHMGEFSISEESLVLTDAKCCNRQTYINCNCANCSFPLCENCGYSCKGCGTYLCYNCVSIFGCGSLDVPMCENCALYD